MIGGGVGVGGAVIGFASLFSFLFFFLVGVFECDFEFECVDSAS